MVLNLEEKYLELEKFESQGHILGSFTLKAVFKSFWFMKCTFIINMEPVSQEKSNNQGSIR